MSKQIIRKEYLSKRKSLDSQVCSAWSHQICFKIASACLIDCAWPRSVGLYCPLKNEVDCLPLFEFFQQQGVICAFPKTVDNSLEYRQITALSQLDSQLFGVKEPNQNSQLIEPDWIFVPGIAFSKEGNRVGFGHGYFDRTLAKLPSSKFIGLAYQMQICENLLPDVWDIKMHSIITNENTY